jgi:hypothetical protein
LDFEHAVLANLDGDFDRVRGIWFGHVRIVSRTRRNENSGRRYFHMRE